MYSIFMSISRWYWRRVRKAERVIMGSQTEGTYWSDCVKARRKAVKLSTRARWWEDLARRVR